MATETGHAGARRQRAPRTLPPRLAEGVELLGEFEDSGFEDPPHLARRADGQVIQLTELLHLVAEAADGERDEAQLADVVSEGFGRRVSADNIRFLVEKKLRPLGVLAAADGSSPRLRKADPLLALKYRTALVPAPAVQRLARVFAWLFSPLVLALALGALVAFDAWLLFEHGVAASLRSALYEPVIMLGAVRRGHRRHRLARGRPRHRVSLRRGQAGRARRGHLPRLAGLLLRRHRRLPAEPPRAAAHRSRRRVLQRAVLGRRRRARSSRPASSRSCSSSSAST